VCVEWEIDDSAELEVEGGSSSNEFEASLTRIESQASLSSSSIGTNNDVAAQALRPSVPNTSDPFRETLNQLLSALLSVDKLNGALMLYKSRLSEDVRLVIRECVKEYLQVFDPSTAVELLEDTGTCIVMSSLVLSCHVMLCIMSCRVMSFLV